MVGNDKKTTTSSQVHPFKDKPIWGFLSAFPCTHHPKLGSRNHLAPKWVALANGSTDFKLRITQFPVGLVLPRTHLGLAGNHLTKRSFLKFWGSFVLHAKAAWRSRLQQARILESAGQAFPAAKQRHPGFFGPFEC